MQIWRGGCRGHNKNAFITAVPIRYRNALTRRPRRPSLPLSPFSPGIPIRPGSPTSPCALRKQQKVDISIVEFATAIKF
jgi:hypothetical protein